MLMGSVIIVSIIIGTVCGWSLKHYISQKNTPPEQKLPEPSLEVEAPSSIAKVTEPIHSENKFDPAELLTLLNEISLEISNNQNKIDSTLLLILKSICSYTKWPLGHIYETQDNIAKTTNNWFYAPYLSQSEVSAFQQKTKNTTFEEGQGIIGKVMETKESMAIKNISLNQNFKRRHEATQNDLKGYFALPVLYNGKVKYIFEFLTADEAELDSHILSFMQFISNQIYYKLVKDEQKTTLQEISEAVIHSINSNENSAETISNDIFALSDIVMNCTTDAQNGNEQITVTKENIKMASEKIKTVSDEIDEVFSKTQHADQVALTCKDKFHDASSEFKSLVDDLHASQKLLTHIHSIATTTNILAMNASIESARAGRNGQSFGVVADEVKNLAAQTSDYADNINSLFEKIVERTTQIQHIMKTTNDEFANLKFISSQMQEILKEQNKNTDIVHSDMEKLVEYSETMAKYLNVMLKSFEEGQEKSDQVSFSTQTLATENNKLRLIVNKFIKEAI